jgi:hypothetical protein
MPTKPFCAQLVRGRAARARESRARERTGAAVRRGGARLTQRAALA